MSDKLESWMNVYDNPEKFGLEILGQWDAGADDEKFDMLLLLRHKETGRVFWAMDSGCDSCNRPFENYEFRDPDSTDLNELTATSQDTFERAVDGWGVSRGTRPSATDQVQIFRAGRDALLRKGWGPKGPWLGSCDADRGRDAT